MLKPLPLIQILRITSIRERRMYDLDFPIVSVFPPFNGSPDWKSRLIRKPITAL